MSVTMPSGDGPRYTRPGRRKMVRWSRWAAQGVAAALSVAVLLGTGIAWATYRSLNSGVTQLKGVIDPVRTGKTGTSTDVDGKTQNILIVGNDDRDSATDAELKQLRTTRDGGSYNTDTMMLMHVPADGSEATLISFPRDSYVQLANGYGMNKLNAAYPLGVQRNNGDKAAGAHELVQTIQNLTGLHIDGYAQVDLLGFYRISEALGGVKVCLNNAVKEPNSGINLKKGINYIEGTQALAFVRQRYGFPDGLGDIDRIKRQQYFLGAVFRQITSAGTLTKPSRLYKLEKAVTSSVSLSGLSIQQFATQMLNLKAGNLKFSTIPTNGFADEVIDGTTQSTVVVDTAALPDFIDTLIGTDAATALKKATAADPSTVSLELYNDSSTDGLETTNAAALRALGFTVTVPAATTDVVAKTTVEYPKGMESKAKAVQRAMGAGVVMTRTSSVSGVTVLLGNNGVQVKSLMTSTTSPSTGSGASSPSGASGTAGSSSGVTTAADAGCID